MRMDLTTFQALLDAHGGDPARWPDGERAAAMDLVARSPEAEDTLAAARHLDALLVQGLPVRASDPLRFRITTGAVHRRTARPAGDRWLSTLLAPWRLGAAAAAAASIALGMVVGLETSVATVLDPEPIQTLDLASLAYGQIDGLEDIQ